jgi:hypothetical protein
MGIAQVIQPIYSGMRLLSGASFIACQIGMPAAAVVSSKFPGRAGIRERTNVSS